MSLDNTVSKQKQNNFYVWQQRVNIGFTYTCTDTCTWSVSSKKINNEYSPSMEVIPSWTNFWAAAGLWMKTLIYQWLMIQCCREASASIQRLYHWCTLTSQNKPNVTPLNGYLMLKSLKCKTGIWLGFCCSKVIKQDDPLINHTGT